ncbi:rRNA-processing protein las1 [Rhodotorula kratochvilovae]
MAPAVPRKTPWAIYQEFQLVFDRLFASDANPQLQLDAIHRINVWLDRGGCPHAVESTAAILSLVLRDAAPSTSLTGAAVSDAELRLSYAMAIVRFVNSLVDPLQTAYFARSIASLAAQIGLPLWFVELRHQATHEDLPRLAVLRDAARQALDWLYTHYWLPTLTSFTSSSSLDPLASLPPLPLSTIRPLLTSYKSLLKSSTRDASLAGRLRADVQKCYRDVERWVAENALGGGPRGAMAEKARERALEGVAEVLWTEGGLVPLAKKKRPTPRAPALPSDLLAVWLPLLSHLDTTYDGFFLPLLIRQGIDLLTTGTELERSYVACVAAWLVELLKDAPVEPTAGVEDDDDDEAEVGNSVTSVVKACLLARTGPALTLLDALLASRTDGEGADPAAQALKARTAPLVQLARAQVQTNGGGDFAQPLSASDAQSALDAFDARLSARASAAPAPAPGVAHEESMAVDDACEEDLNGAAEAEWPPRVQGWKARPVGWLPRGGVLALDLPAAVAVA